MPLPAITNTVEFVQELGGVTRIRITDTADFVAAGYPLNTIEIFLQVTSPDGTVFHPINLSFPDITPSVSRVAEFLVPTDTSGAAQTGEYKVLEYVTSSVGPTSGTTEDVVHELCTDAPELCISEVTNCLSMFLTATDATPWASNGFTVDDRVFTLYYPQGAGPSPIVTASTAITTPDLYTGTYSAVLVVTVTRDNFTGTFRTTKEFKANCMNSSDLCSLLCCLDSVYQRTASDNSNVSTLAKVDYIMMTSLMQHIVGAASCGDASLLDELLGKFYKIGGCSRNCSCGCNDGEGPTLLVPIHPGSGSGTTYTFVQGAGITIVQVGDTVTISMNAVQLALLNSLYNTVGAAGYGISVARTGPAGSPPAYTDTITNSLPAFDSFSVRITYNPQVPSVAMSTIQLVGTTFKDTLVSVVDNGPGLIFQRFSGFISSGTPAYRVNIMVSDYTVDSPFVGNWDAANLFDVKIKEQSATDFKFGFTIDAQEVSMNNVGDFVPVSVLAFFLSQIVVDINIEKLN